METTGHEPLPVVSYVQHFAARVIQDALSQATAAYWDRRAETFLWAAPRAGDWRGREETDEEREVAMARCMRDAQRCRDHAAWLRGLGPQPVDADVAQVTVAQLTWHA